MTKELGDEPATAALLSSPVAFFLDALPPPLLAALRSDAEGLACCSNFWVPSTVLSGEEPALAAFEQAAAALARRCLSLRRRRREKEDEEEEEGSPPPHHPLLSVFRRAESEGEEEEEQEELVVSGAEVWSQIYENGRGLDPHYDKDEEASARGERPLRHPRVSTVVYLNGNERRDNERKSSSNSSSFGATVVINQRLHPRSGAPLPAFPTSSSLLWPRKGAAAAFDGRLAHCVLSSGSCEEEEKDESKGGSGTSGSRSKSLSFDERRRATVLFNFWCGPAPGGVLRVNEEDITAAGLTGPVAGSGDEEGEPTPVPPAVVQSRVTSRLAVPV